MQEWSQHMDTGTERYLKGDLAGAEKGYREAYEEAKEIFAPHDERLLLTLAMLAMALTLQGRLKEAEPLYQRQLDLREAAGLPEDCGLAECLEGYGQVLAGTGRQAEGDAMKRRAAAIRGRLVPPGGGHG
jgi:tetratricopeptide (TPR) repeat protein